MNTFLHTLKVLFVVLVSVFSTHAFGQGTFGTPLFSENFATIANGTTITNTNTNFNYTRVGTSTSGSSWSNRIVALNPSSFTGSSMIISAKGGSVSTVDKTGMTSFNKGAFTFKVKTPSNLSGGLLFSAVGTGASFGSSNGFTGAQISAGFQISGTSLQIRTGTTWTAVKDVTASTSYIITVIFNNSGSSVGYGNGETLPNNKAHIYVDGIKSGEFTAATNGLSASAFRIYATSGEYEIDDIAVYNILPSSTGFSITYNGNSNTSGVVPTAQTGLASGAPVTLANNTGSLVRTGFTFNGWNTVQNGGAGTHYAAGASFTMPSSNVTMYADWKALPKLSPSTTSIAGFDYHLGAGPAEKTFILTGSGLNGSNVGLLLVGGTDFQISADGATYSDNIDYPAYDGSAKTVYVRLKAGLAATAYSDQLLISGGGAADAVVNLSGEVKAPLLTANPLTLSGFAYHQGEGPSNSQSFSLSGQYLSGSQNVEILPGENWEVSTNQTDWYNYSNPLVLNNYAGAANPVYVRLKAGLAEGIYNNASNDIVVVTGYGISAGPEVMLSGEVTSPLPPPVVSDTEALGTYDTAFSYTISATNNPLSFAIVSGTLPGGLNLDPNAGVISGTPTAAGISSVQVTATNNAGTSSPATLTFNIKKKAQAISFGPLSDKVYGDAAFDLSATGTSLEGITYTSSNSAVATVSGNTVTITGAGSTTITATQSGDSNYEQVSASQSLNVTPKTLTISGLTANNKVQDGTTTATLSGTASLTNVVADDEALVSLSGTPVGTFASAGPGTGVAVTVTGLSLTGDKAANYTLTPLVLSADITGLGAPVATAATSVEQNSFTANWNEVGGAGAYELDVYMKTGSITTADVTAVFADYGFTNAQANPSGSVTGGFTFTTEQNGSTTVPAYYDTGTGIRLYGNVASGNGNTFTLNIPTNVTVSKIDIIKSAGSQAGSYSYYVDGSTSAAGNGNFTSGVGTVTLPSLDATSKVVLQNTSTGNSSAVRIASIKIYYTFNNVVGTPVSGSPFTVSAPAVSHEVTGLTPQTEYYYTVKSKSGSVLSPKSNEIKVYPQSVGGTVSPDQALCSGATPSDLTLSGHFGEIIRWESSLESSFAQPTVISETSAVLSGAAIGPLSVTTYFRAVVQSGDNPIANSAYVTVTVNPVSAAGTVSENQSICRGAQPTDLSITGSTGAIQWQRSTDNGSFTDIEGATSAVLSGDIIGSLPETTYFRAQLTSGVCSSVITDVITVNVVPEIIVGAVSEDQSICYDIQPADLSMTGSTGDLQWQRSSDNLTFTDIEGATASVLTGESIGNLTATTYFRVQLSNGVCSATSDVITVTVVPNVTVGAVSDNQAICYDVQPADLSITGSAGAIQWQMSTDNLTFTDIEGATASVLTGESVGNLTATTYFRAQLRSGTCSTGTSDVITVTVVPNVTVGEVSENQSICYSTQPADLILTGSTGDIQWEWSTDQLTFRNIDGATSATLPGNLIGSLTATTYFRAQLSSGTCSTGTSDVITVTVVPNVTVGAVAESQSICYGTQPADLSITGSAGAIQWQWSTDNLIFTDIEGATASVLTGENIGNLTATTYFRAQLSNNVCSANSDVITVTVIPSVSAGPINGPTSVRLGYSAQFSTAGEPGGIWSSSNTDIATVSSNGLVTAIGYGSADISYTVNSGCGSPATASVSIQINNTTTWNGSGWDYGVPDASVDAIISGNLTTGERLVSKSLIIMNGVTLTIAGDSSYTTGDFTNNGNLVVESDGNFVQTVGSNNSGTGMATVKRNARMKRLDYTYWGSPVHGTQTLKQFSPGTVDSRFMTYNTIDDTFSTVNPNTTVFVAGKGYAIRASNYYPVWTDPTLESNYRIFEGIFKGQPNNGDINLPLEQTGQTFNLIANPYPSNIDLHALATINNFENKFYFWSNANVGIGGTDYAANNYAVYTGTGGTPAENGNVIPDRYVKVGQGFIVKATTDNLTFTNAMRNNGTGESSFINKGKEAKEVIDRYWLTLASPTSSTNTILIGYPEGATNGYDPEFDAEQLGPSTNSFYSVLDDKKLVIQGRQKPMEVTDVVPLGFKGSAAGQYKISLIKKNGIFEGTQKVYLRDKLNNTITNLHAGNYTFSSQAGIIENRFEIMYVDEILGGNEVKTGELAVYRNGEHFEIKSSQKKISEVEVYDLTGKLIMNVTANQNHVVINSSSWVNGIYLLKIHRNGETVSKKVIK